MTSTVWILFSTLLWLLSCLGITFFFDFATKGDDDMKVQIDDTKLSFELEPGQTPTLADVKRAYTDHVLARCEGQKTKAATLLGVNRRTLYRRSKKQIEQ